MYIDNGEYVRCRQTELYQYCWPFKRYIAAKYLAQAALCVPHVWLQRNCWCQLLLFGWFEDHVTYWNAEYCRSRGECRPRLSVRKVHRWHCHCCGLSMGKCEPCLWVIQFTTAGIMRAWRMLKCLICDGEVLSHARKPRAWIKCFTDIENADQHQWNTRKFLVKTYVVCVGVTIRRMENNV
jgi:hypothetical protein